MGKAKIVRRNQKIAEHYEVGELVVEPFDEVDDVFDVGKCCAVHFLDEEPNEVALRLDVRFNLQGSCAKLQKCPLSLTRKKKV